MRYAQITVDGVTYTLQEQLNGSWMMVNNELHSIGEYPIEVIVTTESGQGVTISVDDPKLAEALTLIATEGITISGERMFSYYPYVIQQILEFQAIIQSEGFEVDFLKNDIQLLLNEAYLTTMSEERVSNWEKALGMYYASTDTLQDRRDAVIARIRGQGKLNTALINSIVNAFTGGTAISYIENSVLYVKVSQPADNKQYKFTNVKRELATKVPAHLGLEVFRGYSTWKEVANNFSSWNDIKQLDSWEHVRYWVDPNQDNDVAN